MIERKLFGGTCVNTGCIPTKTLIASAYAAQRPAAPRSSASNYRGPIEIDMKAVKARKDAVLRRLPHRRRRLAPHHAELHRLHRPRPLRIPQLRPRQRRSPRSRPQIFLNVGGRANVPNMPGIDQINVPHQHLHARARHPPSISSSSAAATSASSSARCTAASAAKSPSSKWVPRLIHREDEDVSAAIKDILEKRRHPTSASTPSASASQRAEKTPSSHVDCNDDRARSPRLPRPPRRGPHAPTPTTSASTKPASPPTITATSPSTTSSAPTSPASGPSATATRTAASPTPPTTTSRSSPPTSSTTIRAASATASPATPSTPTRPSAASA